MPAICLLPTKREIVLQFRSGLSCEVIATKIYNRKNYIVAGIERSVKKMCQWHIFSDRRESEHRPETNTCKAEQVPSTALIVATKLKNFKFKYCNVVFFVIVCTLISIKEIYV